jgi:hypothetical protein
MDQRCDLERILTDAVDGSKACVRNDQLPCAVNATGSPALRMQAQLLNRLVDAVTDKSRIARAVTGDKAYRFS